MYPLAVSTWADEEVEAACAQLRTGMTTMGAKTREFEELFAKFHGCKHAVMVNSGSSANLLMVAALVYSGRLKRGSRVAVPAVSWSTTYAPLEQFGMHMVIVDVDDSFNIDPYSIPDVDAIFAVNLLGNPCEFAGLPDVLLIEDNCEALGATYNGQMCGTFGVMGSHSLFFSHHISTMEGGVITTDDEDLWRMLLMLRAHGYTRDLPEYTPGFNSWEFMVPGYNVRPSEVHAVLGIEQMKRLPAFLAQRRANATVYKELFNCQREVGSSTWFGFALMCEDRGEVLAKISGQFEARPIVAGNILNHPIAAFFDMTAQETETADDIHDNGLFIGNHHYDCTADLRRLHGFVNAREAAA